MVSTKPRLLRTGQISQLVAASTGGERVRVVYKTDQLIEAPNWTRDGKHLIFNTSEGLYRIKADGTGAPLRIDTGPVRDLNNDHILSPDGACIFFSANDGHLYRVPIEGGQPERISAERNRRRQFRHYLHGISPDGATLVYVGLEAADGQPMTRIFTMPVSGGEHRVLTDGRCPVDGPEFSADGAWIYFNSERDALVPGHAQIYRMRPDGSATEQLTADQRVNWFPHPSPDGRLVAFLSFPSGTTGHPADRDVIIRVMRPDGSGVVDLDAFNGGQGTINVPSWSPDSQAFAYVRYPMQGV